MEDTAGDNTFLRQAKGMMTQRSQVGLFLCFHHLRRFTKFLISTLSYVWSGRILTRLIRKRSTLFGSAENRGFHAVAVCRHNPGPRFLALSSSWQTWVGEKNSLLWTPSRRMCSRTFMRLGNAKSSAPGVSRISLPD
jgi:hypothetical protein